MSDITFGTRGINALGLNVPGAATIVWDDLVASFAWEQRIDEGTFGIDIPGVNAGATPYVNGKLGIEVTLTYDVGSFGVDYVLRDTANGFTEWVDERTTPYTPPGGGTTLAQYRNEAPILQPDLDFVSGNLPFTAPTAVNRLTADFVYALQAGVKDIDLSIGAWGVDYDILQDDVISLVNIPDGRINIFDVYSGQPINIDLGKFPVTIEKLVVPEAVSDYGGVTYGAGDFPSLTRSGVGDPFFHASFSMAEFLANLFPAFKILKGEYELAGPKTVLYWTVLDVQANAMVSLVQEVTYTPQGVRLTVDTSYPDGSFPAQRFEGALGDRFAIDTPQGQGRVNADVTYTPYGEWRSKIGVQVSANLEVSALEIGIRNTRIKDFDESIGPLVHFFVPDEQGWTAEPLWLMENRLSIQLDGPNTTDNVVGAVRRYTAWYQNDVVGTNGSDTLQATDEQTFLDGRAGNDLLAGSHLYNHLFGNVGADTLHGMGSGDLLTGGAGNDVIFGDAGNGLPAIFATGFNTLPVSDGDDIILGGRGNDSLYGQAGDDVLHGGELLGNGSGRDLVNGGGGDDLIFAGQADGFADTLIGGADIDELVMSRTGLTQGISLALGATTVLPDGTRISGFEQFRVATGFGADTLMGGAKADSLSGGPGDDILIGGNGPNTLDGGSGDDLVFAIHDAAADHLRGGIGKDTLFYNAMGGGQVFLVMGAEMTLLGGTTASGFEQFEVNTGVGSALVDIIGGGAGDDTIVTNGGNDALGGGGGRNVLEGGAGNDIIASLGLDTIYGDDGIDILVLDAPVTGRALNAGGWVFDFVAGGAQTLTNGTRVNGVEKLDWTGSVRGDDVVGDGYDDSLFGAGGHDSLDGAGGKDMVDGGSGDDVITARQGQAADTLVGGIGDDRLVLQLGNATNALSVTDWYGASDYAYVLGPQGTTAFTGFERLTFRGGIGNDVIEGGDATTSAVVPRGSPIGFGDRLHGGGGADLINGGAGRDLINGGTGADTLIWSPGDQIDGGRGDDLVWVDAGLGVPAVFVMAPLDADDGVDPLDENETVLSDGTRIANVERLRYVGTGAAGAVTVGGGIFNDTITGGLNADSIAGARGADSVLGAGGNDSLRGDEGADTLLGGQGSDRLEGGSENDRLQGGGGGADTLLGGGGDDTVIADGAASADGGAGTDLYWLDRATSSTAWTIDLRTPATPRNAADGSYVNVEVLRFTGGSGADAVAVGNALAHRLVGGNGRDTVTADLSAETAARTVFLDGAGALRFGAANVSGFERAVLLLGSGGDALQGNGTASIAFFADGGLGADTLTGGTQGDSLSGGVGNDSIAGFGGADTLDGFIGRDTIQAGAGRDLVFASGLEAGEVYDGGEGADTLSFATDAVAVQVDLGARIASRAGATATVGFFEAFLGGTGGDSVVGGSGAESLSGGLGNDTLRGGGGADSLAGGGGADSLDGGAGADTMQGGAGNDTMRVDDTADVIVEGGDVGVDLVYASVNFSLAANVENLALEGPAFSGTGHAGNNTITGTGLANLLTGLGGTDSLAGFGGADTLVGGAGADTLAGGGGTDVFRLDGAGPDRIMDREAGELLLLGIAALDRGGALGLAAGALDADRFGHAAGPAGWRVALVSDRSGNHLVFDADGNAATANLFLATFAAGTVLPTASDIVFV